MEIGIGAGHAGCTVICEVMPGLFPNWPDVEFAVSEVPVMINQLERVNSESSLVANGTRYTTRAKEVHKSMHTLLLVDVEVPELVALGTSPQSIS